LFSLRGLLTCGDASCLAWYCGFDHGGDHRGPAQAQSVASASSWKFSITPYLWMPNIDGTLITAPIGRRAPSADVGPND
jgi:hypothetical protein